MSKFTEEDIKLAEQVYQKYDIPVAVTLGQYALESGYGTKTVGKNNYFNIKGKGTNGYKDYESKEESFMAYGKLIAGNYLSPVFGEMSQVKDKSDDKAMAKAWVTGIYNGGYAEDPEYVDKVMGVIESNNLLDTDYYHNVFTGEVTKTDSSDNLKWWADIVVVVFSIIVVIGGVFFLYLMVKESTGFSLNPKKMIASKLGGEE